MNSGGNDTESTKLHGDKLDNPTGEDHKPGAPVKDHKPAAPAQSAIDQLEIPPHEQPQTDGGTKIHGDKLDPHPGKDS